MKKIAILGFGREGKSLLKFLKKSPQHRGAEIEVLDKKFGKPYLDHLNQFNLIFRSPGVPYNLPQIQRAIKKGVKFSSATKLFFDLCPAQIVGVTGTKGKGTTSTLIYQILKKSGRKVLLAGNIGKPALDILAKIAEDTLIVLELSSFQLQDLQKSPHIAAIVDTFPDHQDVHKNMKEYIDAKSNIARHQKKSDVIFYFKNNLLSCMIAKKGLGKKVAVCAPDDLSKNKIMAATVAAYLGCSGEKIAKVLKNFKGIKHRMEPVREINNVRFINDSASTNPQTAAAAVLSLSETLYPKPCTLNPVILIAGGKDKNLDYAPLTEAIKQSDNIKKVILFGENKKKIKRAFRIMNHELEIMEVGNLELAIKLAYQTAKESIIHHSKFIILFSPAAASFDMFKDYADRGERFKKIVKDLKP